MVIIILSGHEVNNVHSLTHWGIIGGQRVKEFYKLIAIVMLPMMKCGCKQGLHMPRRGCAKEAESLGRWMDKLIEQHWCLWCQPWSILTWEKNISSWRYSPLIDVKRSTVIFTITNGNKVDCQLRNDAYYNEEDSGYYALCAKTSAMVKFMPKHSMLTMSPSEVNTVTTVNVVSITWCQWQRWCCWVCYWEWWIKSCVNKQTKSTQRQRLRTSLIRS